ncbi:MAG: hypothetical protein JSV91_05060 [Phycisphaerales bacterium]|nr:MAG: hypothetical protein JSV91_05060 [Phycisphaerales bacterium]
MRTHTRSHLTRFAVLFSLSGLLAALAFAARATQDAQEPAMTAATARTEIGEMYRRWGKARVEYDRETMETILASDFYAKVGEREIPRDRFLSDVSEVQSRFRLTRFDADILTVQQTEAGWTVVITEKLELDFADETGEAQKVCSFWVTRDACYKDNNTWRVSSSEAIGYQNWPPGEKPPLRDW